MQQGWRNDGQEAFPDVPDARMRGYGDYAQRRIVPLLRRGLDRARMSPGTWYPIRRALYAVTLDPFTLQELKRGFLPAGTLVEQPRTTLHQAEAAGLDSVAIRTRSNPDAVTIGVAKVAIASLREAVR